jgi:hypothetical protein
VCPAPCPFELTLGTTTSTAAATPFARGFGSIDAADFDDVDVRRPLIRTPDHKWRKFDRLGA